ncbi:MAG TPA: tRNA lysidine(34) synthetase TilS [Eubacteriales bacterium]|nr:tRNA lysidine(34) synthetase TilS [Eubacteriales bacterium]
MEQKRLVTAETLAKCGAGPADKVLVAFSGGADSTALLLSMQELLLSGAVAGVFAAHLHHGIRGESAERDMAFCETLCKKLGVPFVAERADVPAYAKKTGKTLEQAGRELRYEFLERARVHFGAGLIATAHHADDQAETVLMHLLRGCGTAGLSGMRPRMGDTIRLLLGVSKEEILFYLEERGQDYCEDETNAENDAFRNRVRNELVPLLRRYNPGVSGALCRTAALCRADEAYLGAQAEQAGQGIGRAGGLDKRGLMALPDALKTRIVKKRLFSLDGNVCETDVGRVLALCGAQTGTVIELQRGFSAWTDAENVYIGVYPAQKSFEVPLCLPGETQTPAGTVFTEWVAAYRTPRDAFEAFLDADALPPGLVVRTRRNGDRFFPLGAPGEKKLKDVLIDKKVPRFLRDMPLLCAGREVFFAMGIAVSERAKVRPESKRVLHITFTGGTDS